MDHYPNCENPDPVRRAAVGCSCFQRRMLNRVASATELSYPAPRGMADVHSLDDLEARVRKMRALGVTRWGDIELGPEPPSDSGERDETQRQPTAEERMRRERDERRRVAQLSSGGLVPAVGRR